MLEWIQLPIVWVILVVIFGLIESMTLGLTSIWFGAGALVALAASLLNMSFLVQIVAFILVSLMMLIYTRPVVKAYLKIGKVKTNSEGLIGEKGLVVQRIEAFKTGQVKVHGQLWTAREIEDREVEINTTVEIMEIEGVKLIVRRQSPVE